MHLLQTNKRGMDYVPWAGARMCAYLEAGAYRTASPSGQADRTVALHSYFGRDRATCFSITWICYRRVEQR